MELTKKQKDNVKRFIDLIRSCGLTPDMTAKEAYIALLRIISESKLYGNGIGLTIMQTRERLFSVSKDWRRDLTDLINENKKSMDSLTYDKPGISRLRYEVYQFFSNPNYKRLGIRIIHLSEKFNEAFHYDMTQAQKPIVNLDTEIEDYFQSLLIAIFQMGDLYYSLPKLKEELQGLEKKSDKEPAYTSLKEIPDSELKEIPDSELKKIFNVSNIEGFRKLEQRLVNRNYLDVNRQWLGKAPELIALILCLQGKQYHYFKNSATDKHIKGFFQKLYQIDITQQWEPKRRKNAEKYKSIFTSLVNGL